MDIIRKIQNQPERVRKIILWSVIVIIGVALLFWWVTSSSRRLREINEEDLIKELNLEKPK